MLLGKHHGRNNAKKVAINWTYSPKGQHLSVGQGFLGRPKASAKKDAPGLHGVEHQKRSRNS